MAGSCSVALALVLPLRPRLVTLVILRAPVPPAATGRPLPKWVWRSLARRRVLTVGSGTGVDAFKVPPASVSASDGWNANFFAATLSLGLLSVISSVVLLREMGAGCTPSEIKRWGRGTSLPLKIQLN